MPVELELHAQRELQHASSVVEISRRRDRVGDLTEVRVGDVLVIEAVEAVLNRQGEVGMVEGIEGVGTELHDDAVAVQRKGLGQTKVLVEVARSAQTITSPNLEADWALVGGRC